MKLALQVRHHKAYVDEEVNSARRQRSTRNMFRLLNVQIDVYINKKKFFVNAIKLPTKVKCEAKSFPCTQSELIKSYKYIEKKIKSC